MDFSTLSMEDLKALATDRGIEHKGNISKAKLIELLDIPEVNIEPKVETKPIVVSKPITKKALTPERKAKQLVKVIVQTLDPSEAGKISSTAVTAVNAKFEVSAVVPFGVICELPKCIVQALSEIKLMNHVPHLEGIPVPGTSIKTMTSTTLSKKYSIQYV